MTPPTLSEIKASAKRKATRAHTHVKKHPFSYTVALVLLLSGLWDIIANLIASAIAPWFGLAP